MRNRFVSLENGGDAFPGPSFFPIMVSARADGRFFGVRIFSPQLWIGS